MPRKPVNGDLSQAIALLINNQAHFVSQHARLEERHAEMEAETRKLVARIDAELTEIKAILMRHERMLQALPEAIREKIGFKR